MEVALSDRTDFVSDDKFGKIHVNMLNYVAALFSSGDCCFSLDDHLS
jgi:hypothetical protein